MSIFTGMGKPVRSQDLTGRRPLFEQMRRCSCGAVTYLPLACRSCGKNDMMTVHDWAHSTGRKAQLKNLLCSFAAMLVAVLVIGLLGGETPMVLLAVLPVVLFVVAVRYGWMDKRTQTTYWLFHRGKWASGLSTKTQLLMEEAAAEEYINGYEGDVARLERMLEAASDQQQVEKIYLHCRQLAQVFHNRRLSALMARCLMRLNLYEGICVDLDEICRHLVPEDADMENQLLSVLSECARFTCIPPGDDTAHAMLRIFGVRLQRAYAASAPSTSTLASLVYKKNVHFYFTQEEREQIRRIWVCTGGAGCLDEELAAAELQRINTAFEESGKSGMNIGELAEDDQTFARYWSDLCWYDADSEPRKALEKLIDLESDPMVTTLFEQWAADAKEEE